MSFIKNWAVSRWFAGRRQSFACAFRGLAILFEGPNARIHFVATLLVVAASVILKLSMVEWLVIISTIAWVWVAEALNTALESLANAAVPDVHPLVRNAKDVAAGAVLLAAMGAMVIGAIVFIPRLCQMVH
jgi:diacylglycerol kinase (ATP)